MLNLRMAAQPACPATPCVTGVMYQVTAGQALQTLCHTLSGSGGGCLRLTWWIFIFSASQLLLCLLPDISR